MLETDNDLIPTDAGVDDPEPASGASDGDPAGPKLWPLIGRPSLNLGSRSLGPGLLGDLSIADRNDADQSPSAVRFASTYPSGGAKLGPGLLDAGLALLSAKTAATGIPPKLSGNGVEPDMTTSPQGRAMIESFEGGAKPRPYRSVEDSANSVGVGHKIQPGETYSGALTPRQSDALFDADIKNAEKTVRRAIGVTPLMQNQFDALVSFAFSTPSAFDHPTPGNVFLARLQSGDLDGAANRMLLYDRAGGNDSMGVQRRRLHEWDMFMNNSYRPFQ